MMLKTTDSPALLVIRLALGVVMFAHGAQKVLGWFGGAGPVATLQTFQEQLGFAPWLTIVLMVIEFFGSLGLIAGLLTRLSALGIATSIGVCAYMNHLKHGFFMNWFGQQAGEGFEYHILVIGIALALVIGGGGALSADRAISGEKAR